MSNRRPFSRSISRNVMPKVILQPAGSRDAAVHFKNTILSPVSLHRCAEFLSAPDIAELAEIYGRDGTRVWGVMPGEGFMVLDEHKSAKVLHDFHLADD